MGEVEEILRKEQQKFSQDKEVERIVGLESITENPLEILDLPVSVWAKLHVDLKTVKKIFRQKSLLDTKREKLFKLVKESRSSLFYKLRINQSSSSDLFSTNSGVISQETVERHLADPKIFFQLKREVRLMAADKKVRVEVKYKNEASEQATRIDTLIQAQRKRKREQEEKWAENRESRVGGWRKFNEKKSKKKSKGEFEFE